MKYVDGFVLPVPKKKLKAYARIASLAGKVWKEHGALEYRGGDSAKSPLRPGEQEVVGSIPGWPHRVQRA